MKLVSIVKWLMFLLLMGALTLAIYFQLTLSSNRHHQNIMKALSNVDNNVVLLNEQVLKAHQGLLRNYDGLSRTVDEIQQDLQLIKQDEFGHHRQSSNLQGFEQDIAKLATATEQFLSLNAVLSNSLSYLPNLINQFDPDSESDYEIIRLAYRLLDHAFLYNRWHEDDRKAKIEVLIDKLLASSLTISPDKADLLSKIISHSQVIYTYTDKVNIELKFITNNQISSRVKKIRNKHKEVFYENYQRAEYLKLLISGISVALLIILINFILEVRSSAKRISQSNDKLALEIEQRRQAESKLQSEKIFLQTILDNISDGIVVCNNQGFLVVLNKAAEVMYGQGIDQMEADHSAQKYRLFNKKGKELVKKSELPLYLALEEGRVDNEEIVIKSADDSVRTVLINGAQVIQEDDSKQGAVICIRDISERKKAEMEMRLAATAFETQEAIMIADYSQQIIRVNKKFSDITGYQAEEVMGLPITMLQEQTEDANFFGSIQKNLDENRSWQGDINYKKKNGETYLVSMSLSMVADENDEITHYVSHFWDITEAKLQQEQKIRSADEDRMIADILKMSFLSLEIFMQYFADAIIALPWLRLQPKCGICLNTGPENKLSLVCNKNLTEEELAACVSTGVNQCCCENGYDADEVQFSRCINTTHSDCINHCHYHVPITAGDEVLGVVVLYLDAVHQPQEYEIAFLKRIADVMSLGISRKQAEEKVQFLAYHDGLTQLPNRMLLIDRLSQVLARNKRKNWFSALMYIDFDRFKNINDSLGHFVGDSLLKEVANRFMTVLRAEDTVARLGGDEFVVLLAELPANRGAAVMEAQQVANKLHQAIKNEICIAEHKLFISLSIGVTIITNENEDVEEILMQADTAMYQAKENGRNGTQFFIPEMQIIANVRLELEKDLRYALEQNEIHVFYQPQTNARGELVGAEALIRWIHPQRGFVSPVDFIPIAEESGIIQQLGNFVLGDACKRILQWQSIETLQHIAVNVSPAQFRHPDYVSSVENIIKDAKIDATKLTLELTEGILVDNVEGVISKMQELKKLGVLFSIDDFGTGYSSLAYLTKFPLDQLKIDKSFVDDIGKDVDDQVVIETIIAMADRLSYNLIAEGVETTEQIKFLKAKGCLNYQGYYFSKPLPNKEFSEKYL